MENDINEILATKRAWQKGDADRRLKEGKREDRKSLADALKRDREIESRLRPAEKRRENNAFMVAVCIMLALVMILVFVNKAHAYTDEEAIRTIVGEASSQGLIGMTAVAEVIRHKHSLKGFYGFKASHSAHEPKWVWNMARKAWIVSKTSNLTKYADHFENIHAFGEPYWVKKCILTFEYRDHRFYKEVKS